MKVGGAGNDRGRGGYALWTFDLPSRRLARSLDMPEDPKLHRPVARNEGTRLVGEPGGPGGPGGAGGVSRRSFIKTVGVSAAASSLAAAAQGAGVLGAHLDEPEAKGSGPAMLGPEAANITLNINGKSTPVRVEPATTLLEALRLHLSMTGAKEVCDRGACGACSVLVDGRLVTACMLLAVDCIGSKIVTVEGLASADGKLDPVQEMFIKHDALQCGFCTPGFVVASRALLNTTPKPTLTQIKRALSGNICRCGTYSNMFNAVLEASGQAPVMDQKGA